MKVDRSHNAFKRGYERLQSQMSQPGSLPDLTESFFLGPEIPEDHPYCVQRKISCGPNQWPQGIEDLEGFQRTSMEYYEVMFQLAKDIIAVLALTLGYDETFFKPLTDGAVATLRYLHYPPQPVDKAKEKLGIGAHRDYSCITLLLQDEVGGLQVLDEPTGQWLDVCPSFLC
jgi:isopenicillin N synthase-like dioxygenase